ncbi:MAG: hypothetical protein GWN99_09120 [Gemmatimonadetes bacterium]|uniref:Uncharacterized protein n=1 Tax=Candidatus Kutchimonas denitrificans TaxID=3056748 RepID=A0AAE5CD70_9BACT|nr:hypothetical protein [Gemmatimonadota bacterium]NIR76725.1 hypothetical protein [Candidatus Kutchimonas denitrificans]NIS01212.1 hypothetical protein [Gemmatimonadota bacterium]NIT68251.1 hypothetical protein [Gemmatimonadota bacterium]NIW75469.1 hypothetical protein [Gemmatimonadota bacterium]
MKIRQIRPVDVEAAVSVETSAGHLRLSGSGDVVILTVVDPTTLRALSRLPLRLRRSRRARWFGNASRTLKALGVQLRIVSGEGEIARLGQGVRGTLLARAFAMGGTRLSFRTLVTALLGTARSERTTETPR